MYLGWMFGCLRAPGIVEAKIWGCENILKTCILPKIILPNPTSTHPTDTHQTNDNQSKNVGNNQEIRPNLTMSGRGGAAGGRGSWFWRILAPSSLDFALLVRRPVAYTPRASRKKPARDRLGLDAPAQMEPGTRQTQSKSQLRCREGQLGVIDSDSESRHPDIRVRGLAPVGSWIICDVAHISHNRKPNSPILSCHIR